MCAPHWRYPFFSCAAAIGEAAVARRSRRDAGESASGPGDLHLNDALDADSEDVAAAQNNWVVPCEPFYNNYCHHGGLCLRIERNDMRYCR